MCVDDPVQFARCMSRMQVKQQFQSASTSLLHRVSFGECWPAVKDNRQREVGRRNEEEGAILAPKLAPAERRRCKSQPKGVSAKTRSRSVFQTRTRQHFQKRNRIEKLRQETYARSQRHDAVPRSVESATPKQQHSTHHQKKKKHLPHRGMIQMF